MPTTKRGPHVFLEISIKEDGLDDWVAAFERCVSFLETSGSMYGLPAAASELSDTDKETLPEYYNADPSWTAKGPVRADRPPEAVAGRLEIALWDDVAPKASDNFRQLCIGSKGKGKAGKPLHYKGCPLHRVVAGFVAQGGDIVRGDGSGGDSIFGGKFNDDKPGLQKKHDKRGLVSMANSGKNSNTSQFFLTLDAQKKLDGKHVVFGEIVGGVEVLDAIEAVANANGGDGPPIASVFISDCGVLA